MKKKGFALATTFAMMIVIMALSNLVLVLVQSLRVDENIAVRNFEQRLEIMQIASDIESFNSGSFVEKYVGEKDYTLFENDDNLTLWGKFEIIITNENEGNCEQFVVKNDKGIEKLKIEKENNRIVLWQYG